jgi:hypothetical protein
MKRSASTLVDKRSSLFHGSVAQKRVFPLLLFLALMLSVLSACGGAPPPRGPLLLDAKILPPVKQALLPVDFVVCIDNSGSIQGTEQSLVRETTMLLADLAEPGDQLSVITFGAGARIVTSVRIQSDSDRIAFKKKIREEVRFQENRSDIRAGLQVLVDHQDSLFRPAERSIRAPILLSDGKLEPADGKTEAAFRQLQTLLTGALAQTDIYAVVFGDTYSRDTILTVDGQRLNGQLLMQRYIARSPDRYFHAKSLDQLLEIVVSILNKTKGITSLGEKGKSSFRIDHTVELMSLIVRKKSAQGAELTKSSDIQLQWPGAKAGQEVLTHLNYRSILGDALYWSNDYEYLDLIVVRKPPEGLWEVRLPDGRTPEVLSKIVSPMNLHYSSRDVYYLNEEAPLVAWLFNKKAADLSQQPYKLQAHLALDNDLEQSNVFVPLQPVADSGLYFLKVPADVLAALKQSGQAGTIVVELVAQQRTAPASEEVNPWFIRRSSPFTVVLAEPFVGWETLRQRLTRIPTRDLVMRFGADMDTSRKDQHPYFPKFETPPRITVTVERFDDTSQAYQPYAQNTLERAATGSTLNYRFAVPIRQTGYYYYAYRLEGVTSKGAFAIQSPWYPVTVRYGWEYLVAAGVLVAGLLLVTSDRSARLKGQLTVNQPEFCLDTVRPVRLYDSSRLQIRGNGLLGSEHRFTLQAKRFLFVKGWLKLTMRQGQATVNGRRVRAGKATNLQSRRQHTMRFTRAGDGLPVDITINLRV